MKNFILIFSILLPFSLIGCCNSTQIVQPHPVVGKWKSDKDKTFEWLRCSRGFTDEKIKRIDNRNIYGKLILEITEDKCVSLFGDDRNEFPFRIIGIEGDTIAFVAEDPLSNESEIRLIIVEDDNRFSIYQDDFEIREFFTKMK